MNLIISFSGRTNGNCDDVLSFIATESDTTLCFRDLNVHACSDCTYECFYGWCKYHDDDIYKLYECMQNYEKIFLIVPMYCGNPSSLYFKFCERSQDFFMHNEEDYEKIISKLYIIGIYGDKDKTPDFMSCFEKWFESSLYNNHVLGIERHRFDQKLGDKILKVKVVREMLEEFVKQ